MRVKKIWQSPVLPGLVLPGAIAMPPRSHEWCDPYYSSENYPWSAIEQANMLREGCYEGGTPWGPIMCCPAPIAIGQPIFGPGMGESKMIRRRVPRRGPRTTAGPFRMYAAPTSLPCPAGSHREPYYSSGPHVLRMQARGCDIVRKGGQLQWCCPMRRPATGSALGDNGPTSAVGAMLPMLGLFVLTGFLMAGMSK